MSFTTVEYPYELLVRWGQTGNLQGAHFQKRFVTSFNGTVVGEFVGNVEPIDPLSPAVQQIMSAEQANAVTALANLEAQRNALQAEFNVKEDELQERITTFETEKAGYVQREADYIARIAELESQIPHLETPESE